MNYDQLVQDLKTDEGVRAKVYKDSCGIDTIGVGRNLRDVGLSGDEINYLLKNDIARVEADLDRTFPWWRQLSEKRQRVVCNLAFNLGITKLATFVNTMRAMQDGRYDDAASGMANSLWATQVGQRAVRLEQMMREG